MQDEMQEAGYILLMPGGDWNADTTYHILHLVNHNGASWLCKVEECTGQEPSDSNTEFWQRFGTAVDLSNYAPLERVKGQKMPTGTDLNNVTEQGIYYFDGVATNYTNTPNSTAHNGIMTVDNYYWNEFAYAVCVQRYTSLNLNKTFERVSQNKTWKPWQEVFTTAGGTINGTVNFQETDNNGTGFIRKAHNASADYGMNIMDRDANGNTVYLRVRALENKMEFVDTNARSFNVLHTGNKPTGTYTGNGDATTRTISTGGIGNVVYIKAQYGFAIVTSGGYIAMFDGSISHGTDAYVSNGDLKISSTSTVLNASGVTYTYQVL